MILQIFFLVVALIIYLIFQKNIITLAVLKSIILYPKLNELKTVKKLHIIYSFSILFSFILTPVISNIILRTFFSKNDFIFQKLDNKSFKGSKIVLSELTLDFTSYSYREVNENGNFFMEDKSSPFLLSLGIRNWGDNKSILQTHTKNIIFSI